MRKTEICPMLLKPAFRAYPWGGERLLRDFGKETDVRPLAESWEVSCHEGWLSVIASGPDQGRTLRDYLLEEPKRMHEDALEGEAFPLLIKLIDAKRTLALQVHPDDAYARREEGSQGKTEMWVVLDAAPGAGVYYGFKENTSEKQVRDAIEAGTLCDLLAFFEVRAGDAFFIPSGVVHAIGEGLVVAEVQQNSDITYRLYDFGYLGPDGKPREMHIDKGLEVARLQPAPQRHTGEREEEVVRGGTRIMLADCEWFSVSMLNVEGDMPLHADGRSFHALLCVSGSCGITFGGERLTLDRGASAFVPAGMGEYVLSGSAQVLLSARGHAQG